MSLRCQWNRLSFDLPPIPEREILDYSFHIPEPEEQDPDEEAPPESEKERNGAEEDFLPLPPLDNEDEDEDDEAAALDFNEEERGTDWFETHQVYFVTALEARLQVNYVKDI